MPDITLIASALGSINTAIDIAKTIKKADSAINAAFLKLQLADLMNALAESKLQIADIKNLMAEKENTISTLEQEIKRLLSNEKPTVHAGCYTFEGDENWYCTVCWDKDMKKIRTTSSFSLPNIRLCPNCKAELSMHG